MDIQSFERYPIENRKGILQVTIRLTEKCNHACEYCSWYNNSKPNMSDEEFLNLFKTLKEVTNKDRYHFFLTGGEPTLYPNMLSLMYKVHNMYSGKCHFHIQTNGSRGVKWYSKACSYLDDFRVKANFGFSYQEAELKNKGEWMRSLRCVESNGKLEYINMMIEKDHQSVMERIHKLISLGYREKIRPFYIDRKVEGLCSDYDRTTLQSLSGYSDEEFQIQLPNIKTTRNKSQVFDSGLNKFQFYKCNAGMENIILENNGDVYICTTHYDNPILNTYNIFQEPHRVRKLTEKPNVCIWDECTCELWLKKERIKDA